MKKLRTNKKNKNKSDVEFEFIVKKNKRNNWLLIISITLLFISGFLGWITSTNRYTIFPNKISNKTQVVVFYQPDCPHCIAEFPTINKLSKNFSISAINIVENKSYIDKYNITGTPTLLLINHENNKEELLVGSHSYEEIVKAYNQLSKGIMLENGFKGGSCSANPKINSCNS